MAGERRIGIDGAARQAGTRRLAAVRFIEDGAKPGGFGAGKIEEMRHWADLLPSRSGGTGVGLRGGKSWTDFPPPAATRMREGRS